MSTTIKYRNFQCPKCRWSNKELSLCGYGGKYIFEGTKFKGTSMRLCSHYKEVKG